MSSNLKILLVDDEEFNLDILEEYIEELGLETNTANNGKEALERLEKSKYDIIILDRMMPIMDGIEFLEKIKNNKKYSEIPVIMQTAASSETEISEGLEAGVFYYLIKPFSKKVFLSILNSAIEHLIKNKKFVKQRNIVLDSKKLISEVAFEVVNLDDAKVVAEYIADFCPNKEEAKFGILELIVNSVEHGNLEIDFFQKKELLEMAFWEDEIKIRLQNEKYKNRRTKVHFAKLGKKIIITISDQGSGFDPEEYLEIKRSRLSFPNGRGIAMSKKMSFDSLNYNKKGNVVMCEINLD